MFNHNSHGNGLLGFTGLLLLGAAGVLLYQNKPGFFLSLLTFIHDYPQLLPQAAQERASAAASRMARTFFLRRIMT